jgi:hypothetical protein
VFDPPGAQSRDPIFILLCGELYRAPWEREDMPHRMAYQSPLSGMGIGQQLAWFSTQLGRKQKIIPIVTHCPRCTLQHVDRDEWMTRAHRTHRCEACGHEWRPANVYTVGVRKLPTL